MTKVAATRKVGVPIVGPLPPDFKGLVAYWGAVGFTPFYEQEARLEVSKDKLTQATTADNVSYFTFDPDLLPALEGDFDFHFTFEDNNLGESDFSEGIEVPLDRSPPPAPGKPFLL